MQQPRVFCKIRHVNNETGVPREWETMKLGQSCSVNGSLCALYIQIHKVPVKIWGLYEPKHLIRSH